MGGNRSTRRKPTTFGRALTMLFSHEDWVRVHIKMTLLGIELGTLEVKGEWSDHYTTEAPRSYIITTTDGQQYRRNRRDLLKTNIRSTVSTDQTEIDDEEDYPTTIPEQPVLNPQNPPDVRRSLRTTAIPRKYRDYVMK